jgi:hypothetical protein
MAEWVTGAEILEHAGVPAPGPADSEWADACAAAVNDGMTRRLDGAVWVTPPGELVPELVVAARSAGVEAYKRREAVFGITGYVDLQGAAVRVARDYLEAIAPILERYATRGLA